MKKIIFLDRDGTLNVEKDYLHKWSDFEFEKNVIEGLKELQSMGFEFIVVTNQSGIARGYYTEKDLKNLNDEMIKNLKSYDIDILDCYYCPHHPEKGIDKYKVECDCRKPNPGMLIRGIKTYNIDVENSFMIGDKKSDIEAGLSAGVTPILVLTGYGQNTEKEFLGKYYTAQDLLEAANIIKHIYSSKI